ncbi:hypothetical protein [Vibrio owensii]|uniref:hypothetical protein n=1 Tax=Vibrio owensii TaxID=696485 RepID=UPI003CC637E2
MKHVTPAQLNDLASQAYLVLDVAKATPGAPELKKRQSHDLIAQAMGYNTWSQLSLNSKGKEDRFEYIAIFNTRQDATTFFVDKLQVSEQVAREFAGYLPLKLDESYPYIAEACAAYDIKCERVDMIDSEGYALQYYTLRSNGDLSVGIKGFESGLAFENKDGLERFLQRHVGVLRSGYVREDMMNEVFIKLRSNYEQEITDGKRSIEADLTDEEKRSELFLAFMMQEYIDDQGQPYAGRDEALIYQFFFWLVKQRLPMSQDAEYDCGDRWEEMFNTIDDLKRQNKVVSFTAFGDSTFSIKLAMPAPKSLYVYLNGDMGMTAAKLGVHSKVDAFSTVVCVNGPLDEQRLFSEEEAKALAAPFQPEAVKRSESNHRVDIVYQPSFK